MEHVEYVNGPLCVWTPFGAVSWRWKDYIVLSISEHDFVLMDQQNRTIGVYDSLPMAADRAWDIEQMYVDLTEEGRFAQ